MADQTGSLVERLNEIADYLEGQSWSVVVPEMGRKVREAASRLSSIPPGVHANVNMPLSGLSSPSSAPAATPAQQWNGDHPDTLQNIISHWFTQGGRLVYVDWP